MAGSHEVKYVFPSNNKALAHCLQNLKWPLGGPKMSYGVFDPSTRSMRKGCDAGKKNGKWKKWGKNSVVYSDHQRCCLSTARTPTDWNAACSCQNEFEKPTI